MIQTLAFRAKLLWIVCACSQRALPYVDGDSLIPEEAVLHGQKTVTNQEAGALSVRQILHLPPDFRSLILLNRRLLMEAEAGTFVKFTNDVSLAVPGAPRMSARMVVVSIHKYIGRTILFGENRQIPEFYRQFFQRTERINYALTKSEQSQDLMMFLSLDYVGTPLYHSINLENGLSLAKRASPFTRFNLAKRAVLEHLSWLSNDPEPPKPTGPGGRKRADQLIEAASASKSLAPGLAVLKCLVLSANGEKAAAKKLANQYRTNESLNIHYREGLLEMVKTGDWQKLRKAMDQPFIVGWKKGD